MNATTDMRPIIVPKSDQINADDLLAGPRTITVREVTIRPGTDQPVSIFFEGDNGKPYKCCKSMARVLVHAWGPDAKAYIGRSMSLYCDPKVKWGGMQVGGIRISHMSHIDRELLLALTETKGKRAPFVVKPLANAPTKSPDRQIAEQADDAAKRGTDAFRAFWKGLNQADRHALQPSLANYQSIAKTADDDAADQTKGLPDDPFADQSDPSTEPKSDSAPYSLFDPRSGEVEQHDGKGWIAAFKKLQAVCTEPFDLWEQTNIEAYQAVCAACLVAGNKKAKAELDAIGQQAVKLGIL